jgi:Tfp pilus assembly protein PilF
MKKLLLATLAGLAGTAFGTPYLPSDDGQVLERLPVRRGGPVMAELRRLSGSALAWRYFELAMAQGDPRYVGYAEAALRGSGDGLGADGLFVRGLLKQYRHDFDGALADLAAAAQRDPQHVGARSWRAAIHMVRAEYAAAREQCRALEAIASELLATGCRAYVDATTGRAAAAYRELRAALEARPDAPPALRLWVLTRLAEMAWRLERAADAEAHFREALALGIDDNFLLAAYADFLLEKGRPQEVVALLRDWTRSDTLLLRLALAEKRLGAPGAEKHVRALAERFAASALRGERLHLAEEARFQLELMDDAERALAAASENWRSQREPRDAAVLLEAAAAARAAQLAAPALRWLEESGFESARLRALAARLR